MTTETLTGETMEVSPKARSRRLSLSVVVFCALAGLGAFATGCQSTSVVLAGTVSNTVTAGAPQAGVAVRVYADANETLIATTYTNSNGAYQFRSNVVPDGTYRIQFSDGQWWNGAADWADAIPVSVSAATPATLDTSVTVAVGTVTGRTNVGDLVVVAFDQSTGRAVASTAMVGVEFTIPGVPVGNYTFGIFDPEGIMRAEVVGSSSTDPTTGRSYTVLSGRTLTITDPNDSTLPIPVVGRDCLDSYAGADLSGHDFTDDILINCNFQDADLTNADFTNADLTNAQLSGTDLTGVTVAGTDLTRANLTYTRSANVVGTPAALPDYWYGLGPLSPSFHMKYVLVNGYFVGNFVNLEGADLRGVDLSGLWLHFSDLTGADLTGANLSSTVLTEANFTNANLAGVNLSGSDVNLFGAYDSGVKFINADISDADLTNANLEGADFTNATLTGTTIVGARLNYAKLAGATLDGVTSSGLTGTPSSMPSDWLLIQGYLIGPGANLANATFWSGSAAGATFTDTDLSGADLSRLDLAGVRSGGIVGTPLALPSGWSLVNGYLIGNRADLSGANLDGADLSGVNLRYVRSGNITGTPLALPSGWKLVGGYLIGPWANLANADLAGHNLVGVKFTNSNMTGVNLSGANVSGVKFTNADISGGNLTNANLTGANLTGTTLTGANLTGTDLSGATLTSVTSSGISGTPTALPTGWKLFNGYLIGAGANLSGASLTGADLSGLDLTGTNLTGSYLTGANVTGIKLSGATLTSVTSGGLVGTPSSLPVGWTLAGGYFAGPGAILSYANLSGANLAGLDLTGVDLRFTNLTGVDLSGANLTDANLAGTNLSGATLTGVTSSGITGTPSVLPAGWSLVGGVLVGP